MKILFLCTGNTCRSCMAEVIFNSLKNESFHIAFSAGLAAIPYSKTSLNSALIVKDEFGIDIKDRYAVKLTEELINDSDLILTMTSYMRELIIHKFPEYKEKVFSLNSYVGIEGDIIDPYGGNIDVYNNTFKELKNSILLLLNKLEEDKGIR
ncbi:low molecular weight protein arginine phosphatase [Clostridium malenominatum]|uniref:Low molecular weight protein arginine phosphatase n=1 Tax=Clostridium malenominatum TaxID=1539 RepID=A0ABN1J487_9CLOT